MSLFPKPGNSRTVCCTAALAEASRTGCFASLMLHGFSLLDMKGWDALSLLIPGIFSKQTFPQFSEAFSSSSTKETTAVAHMEPSTTHRKQSTKAKGSEWDALKSQMLPTFARKSQGPCAPLMELPVAEPTPPQQLPKISPCTSPNHAVQSMDQSVHDRGDTRVHEESSDDDSDQDDNEDLDGDEEDGDTIPLDHHVLLNGHAHAISALAMDPKSTRMCTCSTDSFLKLWDFSGMDASFQPFKSWDPCPGQHAVDIQWSVTGDRFLVAFNNHEPYLFDRNGRKIAEFAKGDPYIRDTRRTSGHTSALACITWHPTDMNTFASAGADSTIRIWDTATPRQNKSVIVYKSLTAGGSHRSSVLSIAYSRDGTWIAAGSAEGSVQIWRAAGPSFSMPMCSIPSAHITDDESGVISMAFDSDPTILFTRGAHGDIKKWDLGSAKLAPGKIVNRVHNPTACHRGLPVSSLMGANLALTENQLIIAGTSLSGEGSISVFKAKTLSCLRTVPAEFPLGKLFSCSRSHQLAIATSKGSAMVLYNQEQRSAGVAACLDRGVRKRTVDRELEQLMLERAGTELESAVAIMQADKSKHGKPASIHLHDGRVPRKLLDTLRGHEPQKRPGAEKGENPNTQKSQGGGSVHPAGSKKAGGRDEDARAAILKYAQIAKEEPYWISPAYNATQPKPVLAEEVFEKDELERVIANEDRQRVKRRREF